MRANYQSVLLFAMTTSSKNITNCLKPIKKRGRKPIVESNPELNSFIEKQPDELNLPIFHFNASDDCATMLYSFAKEHRDLKNKQFKLAWDSWTKMPEVSDILNKEANKLTAAGYSGDAMEKMYASARYYYRKKAIKAQKEVSDSLCDEATEKKEKTPRKKYERSDGQRLEQINSHIAEELTSFIGEDSDIDKFSFKISPAQSFENYIAKYPDTECDVDKLKKIYKNRLFLIRNKLRTHTK